MVVAFLVLLGPSAPISTPYARPLPAGAVTGVVPNRVMTWNLCNPCGSGHNAGRTAEIATYAPQVIGVQEACARDVERIRDGLERIYGLVYHVEYGGVLRDLGRCGGTPWRPGAYGQAILSAAPMTDRVSVEYPDGGSEDRGYLAVTTTVDGHRVRVFNTHLAERRQQEYRMKQTRVLAAAVARYDRAIVLGDFNARPYDPELTPVWALATDTDARCAPAAVAGVCDTTTDWHAKFDYVFLRGNVTALGHHVHPNPHSDHALLYTDLRLP
ncbi:hypothetical protein SRB5_47590 [Streptomyces sp. RB5]|uniref:Endonuclease/exonuclease/phosphatase domain-containing protein n=1 Tax=Streptomyces smaragdinus TaxID=2585196 RepID=A0A7K0CMG0_9ACTN|nr:endonuclease/exonuclease/phosphatase family protein [Streptomyces smaragdinus]MQY14591.1 hypothetical protein [Streptomyces smaragdinus]